MATHTYDTLIVGVWIGNDDNSPMRRVTGGSLPASIWRQFVTAASPLIGQQSTPVAAAPAMQQQANNPPPPQPDDQAAPANASAQVAAQAAAGLCDVQACSGMYRSFRASDCTYQPYWGGARQACGRTLRAVLCGAIRDHGTLRRRPFVRYFACAEDLSHDPATTPLPQAIVEGKEAFLVVGAIAGG